MSTNHVTRDDFADFKKNPAFQKLISLLELGYNSAIEHYLETGNDVHQAARTYREIIAVLQDGDVLVDEGEVDA